MHKIIQTWQQLSFKQSLYFTVIVSLLLSLAELCSSRPIDPDSITFINTAHIFWQSGWHTAVKVYPWPFFPIVCVSLSHFTMLPLVAAFHLFNTLAQALLCLSFVVLSKLLGATQRTQKIAALVILLFPFLNSIRVYATRESGYWAFALLAVCFLIRFMQRRQLKHAFYFGLSMGVAFLFRVEGLLMLIAAPMAIFAMPHHRLAFKWRLWCRANLVFISVLFLLFIYHVIHTQLNQSPNPTSRLDEYQQQLMQLLPHLSQQLRADAALIAQAILNADSAPTQNLLLISGLVGLCLYITVSVMHPIIALLAVYGQSQKLISNHSGQATLLYWLLLVNLVMLLLFTFERYFLAPRYPAFLALLWLSWVPFALNRLYEHYQTKNPSITGRHWFFPTLLFMLILIALGGIIRFGYSKAYVQQAGQWLHQNTAVNAKFYSNSKEVNFYEAANNEDVQRLNGQDQKDLHSTLQTPCVYDWIAIRLNQNDQALKRDTVIQAFLQHYHPHIVFHNKRQDAVLIYNMQTICAKRR